MDIITTHSNTDLDALAAMVGAQKLYPEAVMVFPGKLSRNVEEFMALHKDALTISSLRDIQLDRIRRVILVDTKNPRRLGKLAEIVNRPGVEVHIYDHHPRAEGDIRGTLEVVEAVGATATLLVEKIKEHNVPLNPLEATILALGIYGDTGSLVFTSTTPRDVAAVAFLLEKGANLGVVAEFLGRPLTEEQKSLLKSLLISARRYQVNGVKVLLATASVEEFVVGLALLTHTISEIEKLDAVFTVVEMEDRVYIVGRSNVAQVDVAEIVAPFGGGGHPAAASATIKGAPLDQVARTLMKIIRQKVRPPLTAAGIMSSPVKTVTPETTIREAGRIMMRYGHTGLPVVKNGQLVGVISRRDVEKANLHGLGHAPVKGFMSQNVVWVTPDVPVTEVQQLMIEHDIGRVPVVAEGRLVGIVSRTDVLRTLHGGDLPSRYRAIYSGHLATAGTNISELMRQVLAPREWEIMRRAGETAARLGCRVFAAGGVVRDILLQAGNLDIDLVVEGDGIALAGALAGAYGAQVRAHRRFGTAEVLFPDGFKVDVATARVEFYEYPAALPRVESSCLRHDLYRRDFTINAMAVDLNGENFGDLIDFFGGRQDLQQGLIRVLYSLSFIEDPIRLLRAVRFEQRYGFKIEPQTLKLMEEAVRREVLTRVSTERLWEELKHILLEKEAGRMLERLHQLGMWPFVFPGVTYWEVQPVLHDLGAAMQALDEWGFATGHDSWLCYFIAVLHWSSPETARALCERYHLSKRQAGKVVSSLSSWQQVLSLLSRRGEVRNSELARGLLLLPPEAYPLILTLLDEEWLKERFRQLLLLLKESRPSVDGNFIRSLGYRPGPVFRRALDAVWRARLDGLVKNSEEEKAFVKEFLRRHYGEGPHD
ncbi:CBS domain-containing protein [Desulfofundulus thermocisternus]|uniref:CBS domain-containing protein n=1 Tax=Desulfofundulus thermocisternus TaxID=42471 RepID=UPI0019DEF546|nr:CBS domain-containing protein [Desulfofundulus thermocisternus]MBE3584610.1 CBS domain-containing protein [Thermoanaerobacter sp.]MCS5696575.1 CBS domain-containing protein [Desulfofundulus thermocisternus]